MMILLWDILFIYIQITYGLNILFRKFTKKMITKLDGIIVKCNGNMLSLYIYNDYTNLNTKLLDEYDLDLKIFYNELPPLKSIIEEIPMDKLNIIVDQIAVIIENTKEHKDFVFNIDNIKIFIDFSVQLILSKIKEIYKY